MRAIFISYRREDSEGHAGRLSEDLAEHFGKGLVFMDVTGIEPGRDFRRVIEQQVASCGVLLAIIGKEWLTATDAKGQRRLDDPSDFVRLETASALKRDIPVVPVLVHGATMPRAEQLPEDLKDLAFRNSVELTHARWASDVALLISALEPHVSGGAVAAATEPAPGGGARRFAWPVTAGVGLAALAGAGYFLFQRPPRAELPPDSGWVATPVPAPAASVASSGAAVATVLAPPPPAASAVAPAGAAASTGTARPAALSPALAQRSERPVTGRPAASSARVAPDRRAALGESKPASAAPPAAPAAAESGAEPAPAAPPPTRASVASAPAPAPAPVVAADEPAAPTVPSARGARLDLMGSPGVASMATRTIAIGPDTKYVNVTGGEIIRFTVGDKQFVWNFNGPLSSFDLARVAPTVLDRKVTAYVAPNPFYPRRN